MVAEQLQEQLHESFTDAQQLTIAIVPRIAACISLISASYMAFAAFQQRSRIYHRLMTGLALHLILYAILNIYGPSAVPVGTPNVWGASGTTETCTARGFFIQVSFLAAFFYYDILAFYSFQAVRNNFQEEKYVWIEKWIHVAVHIFPFGSAFYLLSVEAFNFTGTYSCWVSSIPYGCAEDPEIVCERGPQNLLIVATVHQALPLFFMVLFPTIVMIALYFEVRRRQSSIQLKAKVVAWQASLYLLALYWALLFGFINGGLQRYRSTRTFVITLLSLLNLNLNGFWMLVIYLYFRVAPSSISNVTPGETAADAREGQQAQEDHKQTIAFNIFDGTNAAGAFSQFIFDADSDDENEDKKESDRWDHDLQKFI